MKLLRIKYFLFILFLNGFYGIAQVSLGDSATIESLLNRGQEIYIEKPQEAEQLWQEGLEIAEDVLALEMDSMMRVSILIYKSDLLFNLSQLARNEGEPEKTIRYLTKALRIDEQLQNKANMSSSYNDLGVVYSDVGLFDKSLEYYLKSLSMDRELQNQQGIAASLINIGHLHTGQENYDEAISYFNQSLAIQIEQNDTLGIITSRNNLASVYVSTEEYQLAMEQCRITQVMATEFNHPSALANSLSKMGMILDKRHQTDSARLFLEQSLELRKKIQNKDGLFNSYIALARFHERKNENDQAIQYAEQAYQIGQETGYRELKATASLQLSGLYAQTDQFEKAYQMQREHLRLEKELRDRDNSKILFKRQFEEEYESKRVQDSLIRLEQEAVLAAEQSKIQYEQEARAWRNKVYLWISVIGFIVMGGIVAILIRNNRQKQHANLLIEQQKRAVESQKEQIERQHVQLEETHRDISDSIAYAKRLQQAIFPATHELRQNLGDGFVYFQPKDVVSGDFYWMKKVKGVVLLATADCTGHGVPGAMVSVVCSNALNRSVNEFELTEPAAILNKTRELVMETFARSGREVRDGMDIALCAISHGKLIFAGANNPLLIVRKNDFVSPELKDRPGTITEGDSTMLEFKGNKQPVGKHPKMKLFDQHEIQLHPSDVLYIFTDGYADQFGGEKGKKMKYKPFKRFLHQIANRSMSDQKKEIREAFLNWKGDLEQLDDVCVIGVRV